LIYVGSPGNPFEIPTQCLALLSDARLSDDFPSTLRFLRNFQKLSIKNTTKLGNFPLSDDFLSTTLYNCVYLVLFGMCAVTVMLAVVSVIVGFGFGMCVTYLPVIGSCSVINLCWSLVLKQKTGGKHIFILLTCFLVRIHIRWSLI